MPGLMALLICLFGAAILIVIARRLDPEPQPRRRQRKQKPGGAEADDGAADGGWVPAGATASGVAGFVGGGGQFGGAGADGSWADAGSDGGDGGGDGD